ncbi:PilZ domain-containing protein [Motiliproteus sp. SC1-56]|uniref:PilZ domain-containing protein n=1 Tax=Motiliproteus sp. SC1-56 TaxID=2799565 RepID=UPI001A8C42DE|nr:PilZ domain-containing protein [Motiliproteus sp. SC1-56]
MAKMLAYVQDARQAPRVEVALEGRVRCAGGRESSAKLTNLSSSGVRLEGSRALVDTILPNHGGGEARRRAASVELEFTLDGTQAQAPILVRCQSVYVRRIGRDWFQLGLLYTAIEPASQARLSGFIRERQREA